MYNQQANVYHATKSDGQEFAVKIYKTSVLVFKYVVTLFILICRSLFWLYSKSLLIRFSNDDNVSLIVSIVHENDFRNLFCDLLSTLIVHIVILELVDRLH